MSHIALLGPSWPLRGGIARTTTALASALDASGRLAAFLTPVRQYPRWLFGASDTDPGACARLGVAEAAYSVLEPWTWPTVRRRLLDLAPEALVFPYWTYAWAPLLARVSAWRVAPAIAVVHNPFDHDASAVARLAARAVLGRCAGFLCHARSVEGVLSAEFPGRPTAVHPLPPDVAPAADRLLARRRLGVPEAAVTFLCFGLIRPYKGVEVLLDAFAGLPAGCPAVLLLAGEPWGSAGVRIAAQLGRPALAGRVKARLGWIAEEDVGLWFGAADVAVLPYRSATGSAVAAQALGYGLPVLATRVGGLAEVVEDGVNGALVAPDDAVALAGAIESMCDAGLRARLAEGVRAASDRWSWSSYAETLGGLVASALR